MENLENLIYVNYNNRIQIDVDMLIVSAWNKYIEEEGGDNNNKIFFNYEEFFKNSFKNSFDAACAVSLSEAWLWSDRFVFFDEEGFITSFSHWDDEVSPIDLDKIDTWNLLNDLIRCRRTWRKKQK